jgi:hypothetical protein
MEPTAPGVALKIGRYLKIAFPIPECLRTGAAAHAQAVSPLISAIAPTFMGMLPCSVPHN